MLTLPTSWVEPLAGAVKLIAGPVPSVSQGSVLTTVTATVDDHRALPQES